MPKTTFKIYSTWSLILIMAVYKSKYYSVAPTIHLTIVADYPNSRVSTKVNSDAPCLTGKNVSNYFLMSSEIVRMSDENLVLQ